MNRTISGTGTFNPTTETFTSTLQKLSYTYDPVGNISSVYNGKSGETQNFTYDSLDRLISASTQDGLAQASYNETYTYNANGNLQTKGSNSQTLQYGDAEHIHAVTDAFGNTYHYDVNGNMDHRTVHSVVNGQAVTLEYELGYDAENRLVSVTGVNGTTMSATFIYDGDGRRVKSIINGETTYFAGGHFILNAATSEVTKSYGGIAVRKYTVPQTTTLTYLIGDQLGSASVAVDSVTGEAIETLYKPWGEVRWTTENKTLPTRYTFTGQYSYMADDATDIGSAGFGLMFYNARWYDPQLGRFAQADTIVPGGVQGLDRYAYVNNNPVNGTDPSGHTSWNQCLRGEARGYACDIVAKQMYWNGYAAGQAAAEAAYQESVECTRHATTCSSGEAGASASTVVEDIIADLENTYGIKLLGEWTYDRVILLSDSLAELATLVGGANALAGIFSEAMANIDLAGTPLTFLVTTDKRRQSICGPGGGACWDRPNTGYIVFSPYNFTLLYQNTRIGSPWTPTLRLKIMRTMIHEMGHVIYSARPELLVDYRNSVADVNAFCGVCKKQYGEESFANAIAFYILSNGQPWPAYQDQMDFVAGIDW